jgi:hypothetical protein
MLCTGLIMICVPALTIVKIHFKLYTGYSFKYKTLELPNFEFLPIFNLWIQNFW